MTEYIILALAALAAIFSLIGLLKNKNSGNDKSITELKKSINDDMRSLRQELKADINFTMENVTKMQAASQGEIAKLQDKRLAEISSQLGERQRSLQQAVTDQLTLVEKRMEASTKQTISQLENIRLTMETRIASLQNENTKKLDEMRQIVDEKLQKALDEKLKQSFSLVNENLEKVFKGLGEMQTLAIGVGDLKKVLSNVKTRGILGEIQLGAILEQILSREQYEENIATVRGSSDRVEYAVKLPGDGETPVYLPIDAKFPIDAYSDLINAYDLGDAVIVESKAKVLETRIKGFAKDIHDKYISVPDTTDFGIMFLPIEGLYAEVVRRGMIERLQNDFHIIIAGPTTMAALLNSLQMGFRTLAIQQRSGEVWKVLSEVKSEFGKFGSALEKAQNRIKQAGDELDELVGTRTRQIQKSLKNVTAVALP